MHIRYSLITLLFCLFVATVSSQELAVENFRLLENEISANIQGPKRRIDQNGEVAALIKVVTTETGFVFEGGLLGIVDTKQDVGEIYVWVPRGAKMITIKHPKLGVLRNYRYTVPIESGRTYEMKLISGSVQQIVHHDAGGQFVVMTVTPANAQVSIDGTPHELPEDGVLSIKLPYGTHEFIATAPLHRTEMGRFEITREGKTKVNVPLRPDYGLLQISSTPTGAEVYIDDDYQPAGITPFTTRRLAEGSHRLQFRLSTYKTLTTEVSVPGDGSTQPFMAILQPNFAQISITVPDGADIYINDQHKGTGSWQGNLTPGLYTIEARKESHYPSSQNITVVAGEGKTYTLATPTPRYGTLEINSTPTDATVSIDGREIGTTPDIFSQVLIGTHTLRLIKEGYTPLTQQITIEEGKAQVLSLSLAKAAVKQPTDNDTKVKDAYMRYLAKVNIDHSTATSAGKTEASGAKTFTVKGVTFTMISVEGGTFTMGATSEQGNDVASAEKPAHKVTLGDYYIGETEVTQALWQAVMGNNPSRFKGNTNRPVENVSWNDCQKFIKKLNRLTGETFRLPTEAEWEYAARGGNKSKGYIHAGSNIVSDVAWYKVNALDVGSSSPDYGNHPVKGKQPNELGLYDMSGNVSEWCSDWYDSSYYGSSPENNPTGPTIGSSRLCRGGSWNNIARICRVSHRCYYDPDYKGSYYGLRLALESGNSTPQSDNGTLTISGTAYHENNEPVIGATVGIKGQSAGAITDIDGRFSIRCKKNDILQISFIGCEIYEMQVTQSDSNVKITLTNWKRGKKSRKKK